MAAQILHYRSYAGVKNLRIDGRSKSPVGQTVIYGANMNSHVRHLRTIAKG
jgi:hypothetical protein